MENVENKMQQAETKKILREFFFPDHQITVIADTIENAEIILQERIAEKLKLNKIS